MEGDYRALYLVWRQFAQFATADEKEEAEIMEHVPPPVPPNLSKLNAALKAFIEFFDVGEAHQHLRRWVRRSSTRIARTKNDSGRF